ncbi:carboxylesterase [Solibacillus sp. R5-41]|uniref:alpha/beta hydrolase n=1 Tax=Solibacillus sp. R5-41 TaxID=2048654 RepID=UPI000C1248AD|nr:alpha/beta hydrolase [Solibacillus sp. R5-41]ATP39971.1 carboxylesterase [Solibacillus sp. R5-41]
MKHIFKEGKKEKPVFLLLHGTGGDENSLLALAEIIDSEAAVLSVRGNVLENGMPRFFRRLAEGVFDMEDLAFRTKELHEFLNDAATQYGFDRQNVLAIGYSNGANIAANLLFHYENTLKGAILHHPMVPDRQAKLPNQTGTKVFIAAGVNDPLCTKEDATDLEKLLLDAGADVTVQWETNGHQLTMNEVQKAKVWYEANY